MNFWAWVALIGWLAMAAVFVAVVLYARRHAGTGGTDGSEG